MSGSTPFRTAAVVTVLAATLSIAGCANLFTGNMFANFDGPPSASELVGRYTDENGDVSASDADGFVGDIEDAAGSSRFFEDLSDSDRASLTGSLESVYDNGDVDSATRQRAAVLAADVTLRGADSGETINNVANVLTSDEGADSFSSPQDLMDQIIPDSAKNDPVAIQKILDDMRTAADAYDALGGSLKDDDGDGEIDNVPEDTNMAEVAQKAAVAMVVRNLVEQDEAGSGDLAERIANGTVGETDYSNPLSSEQDKDGDAFNNILKAGGLGGFFDSDE